MLTLKIIKYNKWNNYHECRDEHGNVHRVDLVVDASLKVPEDAAEDNDKYDVYIQTNRNDTTVYPGNNP